MQRALGKSVLNLAGVGAYAIDSGAVDPQVPDMSSAPSSMSIMNPKTARVPSFKNGEVDIIISRSEYITDIVSGPNSPSLFDLTSYSINPGLPIDEGGCFQWLPNIAASFQQYQFKQLVFEYRPTSGNATGSNTALGTVTLSGAYDPTADVPTSKLDMLNQQFAISGTPANEIFYPIECKQSEQSTNLLNIRTGALTSAQNIVNYDYARMDIASNAIPTGNQVLGELWVTYTVKLSKYSSQGSAQRIRTAQYTWNDPTGAGGGNIVSAFPIGQGTTPANTLVPAKNNQLPLTFNYNLSQIQFPKSITQGVFLVQLTYRSAAVGEWVGPAFLGGTNCQLENWLFAPTTTRIGEVNYAITAPDTDLFSNFFYVRVTGAAASFELDAGGTTFPLDITDFNLIVTEVNPLVTKV